MLASCPFCGGAATAQYLSQRYGASANPRSGFFQDYWVGCPKCDVFIKTTVWRKRIGNQISNFDLIDRLETRRKWNYYAS